MDNKVFIIRDFSDEELDKFTQLIPSIKEGDKLTIILDSEGGSVMVRDCYEELIRQISTMVEVKVIGVILMSAAFTLFRNLSFVNRILIPSAYGMMHTESWNVRMGARGVPKGDYEQFKLYIQQNYSDNLDFMSEEEKTKFYEGGDIYFDFQRLKKIFEL